MSKPDVSTDDRLEALSAPELRVLEAVARGHNTAKALSKSLHRLGRDARDGAVRDLVAGKLLQRRRIPPAKRGPWTLRYELTDSGAALMALHGYEITAQ